MQLPDSTGSSTQALVRGASVMPAQLKGTLAPGVSRTRAGGLQAVTGPTQLIRQRSTTVKPSKASHHTRHGGSTYEDSGQRTTERENEQPRNLTNPSWPTPASLGWPKPTTKKTPTGQS